MATHDRSTQHDLTPSRAIIDIGSNTVRLVIYGGPPRAPSVLHNEKVSARLGKGVSETGRLAEKAVRSTLAALARFRVLLDLKEVHDIDVVATAAVRDASDGAAFLDRVRALGFAPRLLSGEAEAEASAMGVIGAFPGAAGIVADLGGGSLELVDVADSSCRHGVSLPLGTLRLPQLRAAGERDFTRKVESVLGAADWSAPHSPTLYLVGGSFRSFARYALQHRHWPSDDPHGFEIGAAAASDVARELIRPKGEALAPVPGIGSSRLASLPDAAALLQALIVTLKPANLVFSSWGLREGLLYAALDDGVRTQDPLLAGISAFIEHHGASPAIAAMVAGWTALTGPERATSGDTASGKAACSDERLRLAATMLALASANVEPNLRVDLAVEWAMRKRWIGITSGERAMLAASLMANAGRTDLPLEWRNLASDEALREAQGWGLAARLCRRFSGCSARSLSSSELVSDGARLKLVVNQPYGALVNDGVQRDLKALGSLLGLKPSCEIVGDDDGSR